MPAYTVQKDPVTGRLKTSLASPSTYCDDYDDMLDQAPAPPAKDRDMPHPDQQIMDGGPQTRGSRLPIFNQVRSMLHKPPPGKNPKWDRYTGEISEQGVPANVKPSNYVNPFEGALKPRRKSPERQNKSGQGPSPQPRLQAVRDQSPVSMLFDEDMVNAVPNPRDQRTPSPVSPVSPVSPIDPELSRIPLRDQDMVPKPLSANVRQLQSVPQLQTPQPSIQRKPAPRSVSTAENVPPSPEQKSPSQFSDPDHAAMSERDGETQPKSHMSWTTYAPSVAQPRASTETATPEMHGRMSKPPSIYPSHYQDSDSEPRSRFSWSTVNTNMTAHARPDSGPVAAPPPIPDKYIEQNSAPPVQSILSRRRPIQRLDYEERTPPPPRKSSMPVADHTPKSANSEALTPLTTKSLQPPLLTRPAGTPTSAKSNKSGKALPPPPTLSPSNNLTHLEALLAQGRDLLQQRRNVERAIVDMEKIEKASPLEVDFSQVRHAKRKLEEHRKRLDEVRLEERDIGVAISRARRKEGEEEGLWVRRVTG